MPVSERKHLANQQNARRSNGPTTADGKLRCRYNAVRHGMFAVDVVLPGEDHQAYAALRRELIQALRPQDALQLGLVERVAVAQWRLCRLQQAQRWLYDGRLTVLREEMLENAFDQAERKQAQQRLTEFPPAAVTALMISDEDDALGRLSRYEQRLELSIARNLRQLRELQNPKNTPPIDSPYDDDSTDLPAPIPWAVAAADQPADDPSSHEPICENGPTEARMSRNITLTAEAASTKAPATLPAGPDPPNT